MHHVALRVADAEASKAWFLTKLGFHVDREFSFGGMDFVWVAPSERKAPVIEIIGGGEQVSRHPYDGIAESLKRAGCHHICLQVDDLEQIVAELRGRDVKILIDDGDGAPGSGGKKLAFIADPWGNLFELLELDSKS
jgi:catechol 2,3-dioxygenase-like lactoylglutathione lyase family enzyme